MELRKDPITRSWVITGDYADPAARPERGCRFCPNAPDSPDVVSTTPSLQGGPWAARAVVHTSPLYHIEGEPQRHADGLYDKMCTVGAHEVLVENPRHDGHLWTAGEGEIAQFLLLVAQRIHDLKRDRRIKYVTVFKNYGASAGQEFEHPTAQLTATAFVPRRVLYELRAGKDYFTQKERCVFCDILDQEERKALRMVEKRGDFVALCPYAPRVPYETWLLPRPHEASFERAGLARSAMLAELGMLLKRTLNRIRSVTEEFHLVLHTVPNTLHRSRVLGYWETIDDDYHWHIEILPIVGSKSKSYTFKEVYFTSLTPETAAQRLREASPGV